MSRGRLPAPVQSAAVRSDEGSNSRRSEDETTAAEPSVASPGSLRADAGRLRAVQGRGILATMGKWWQLSDFHFKARGRAKFRGSRLRADSRGSRCGGVDASHRRTYRGFLSGDAVSHALRKLEESRSTAPAALTCTPIACAGSPPEQPWADRAPWVPQSYRGSRAQQGAAPGASTRRGVPI